MTDILKKGLISCNINDAHNWSVISIDVPRQDNNVDCDVYVCLITRLLVDKLNIELCSDFKLDGVKVFRV